MKKIKGNIKYLYIDLFDHLFDAFTNNIEDLKHVKAIIIIFRYKCFDEKISVEKKIGVLNQLCSFEGILIGVFECDITDNNIEYCISLDICLPVSSVEIKKYITYDNLNYFTKDYVYRISGCQKENDYILSNAYNLPTYKFINKRIQGNDIEREVEEFVGNAISGKSFAYIEILKRYFNLYKVNENVNRKVFQQAESNTFCELALRKNLNR